MDATATLPMPATPSLRFRRWLPYWAVLQTDLRQTLRSWVYRLWVVVSVLQAREGRLMNPAYDVAALLLAYGALGAAQLAARRYLYGGPDS